jgi:hypothetical protein
MLALTLNLSITVSSPGQSGQINDRVDVVGGVLAGSGGAVAYKCIRPFSLFR